MFTGGTLDLGLAWAAQPSAVAACRRTASQQRHARRMARQGSRPPLRRAFGAPLTGHSSRVKGPEAVRRLFPFCGENANSHVPPSALPARTCGRRRDNILVGRHRPAGKARRLARDGAGGVIDRSQDTRHSAESSGVQRRRTVWNSCRGNHLGSGHVRPQQQAGHMIASDPIHTPHISCKQGAVHIWIPDRTFSASGMTAAEYGRKRWIIRLTRELKMTPEGGVRGSVGLLAGDTPIAQILKLDGQAGHRATDMVAFRQDLKIGVEIAQLGFAPRRKERLMTIHDFPR